jgi:hypothetical protein
VRVSVGWGKAPLRPSTHRHSGPKAAARTLDPHLARWRPWFADMHVLWRDGGLGVRFGHWTGSMGDVPGGAFGLGLCQRSVQGLDCLCGSCSLLWPAKVWCSRLKKIKTEAQASARLERTHLGELQLPRARARKLVMDRPHGNWILALSRV